MQIVIDSNIINILLQGASDKDGRTEIDVAIESKAVVIAIDPGDGIRDEWARTCGSEYVKQLIVHWSGWNAFFVVSKWDNIDYASRRELKKLKFGDDAVDKLILRTAVNCDLIKARFIVSHDSDFWNPCKPGKYGDSRFPVTRFLRQRLEVTVCSLNQLLKMIGGT